MAQPLQMCPKLTLYTFAIMYSIDGSLNALCQEKYYQMQTKYAHKCLIETEFSHKKDAKGT